MILSVGYSSPVSCVPAQASATSRGMFRPWTSRHRPARTLRREWTWQKMPIGGRREAIHLSICANAGHPRLSVSEHIRGHPADRKVRLQALPLDLVHECVSQFDHVRAVVLLELPEPHEPPGHHVTRDDPPQRGDIQKHAGNAPRHGRAGPDIDDVYLPSASPLDILRIQHADDAVISAPVRQPLGKKRHVLEIPAGPHSVLPDAAVQPRDRFEPHRRD